jgi:hypothetical protein
MLGLCNVLGVTNGETSSTSRAIVYIDPHHADVMRSKKTEKLIDYVDNCESRRVKCRPTLQQPL